ncbi:MAG TPA: glycosyltransferase family 39 protein [Aggregatilineaceae bacterium]|nr:glycosyltransferase family 39 protein [Aggregatilineaceae bacterium]
MLDSTRFSRLVLLTLILLLGWTLRTHALEERSLWEDEGWTMLLSKGPGLDDVTRTLAADQHPPLYFMVFRLWRDVAGDTEFAGRYLGVLIGMVAVAGMMQFGRSLYNPAVGVLAALLLAVADLHIDLSQEIRHYAALATLSILSSLLYVRWWKKSTRANRIGYVLSSIALLYTHYLGGFVLFTQVIHMLIMARPWKRLAEGLFLFGAVCLGFLPWFFVVIDQNSVRWDNPLYYQNSLPNNEATYRAVRDAVLGNQFGVVLGLALLGLVYVLYQQERIRFRLRPVWPALYLLIWIGLVAGLTFFINSQKPFLTVRNFLLVLPPLAVLVGHGLANLKRAPQIFLVSVLLVVSLTTVDARRFYPDWRSVTQHVTDYHLDHEPVLMDVWVGDFPVRYYIEQQMGEDTPWVSLREWRDTYKGEFVPHMQDYLASIDAFWLIYWGDKPMDDYGPALDLAGFQRTATLSVDHLGTPLYSYRYDKLTNSQVAEFGELFALRKFNAPQQAAPGEHIRVSLWWTAEQKPPLDYSVSVVIVDAAGQKVAQHDGPPLEGVSPTSTWEPGELKYDIHTLAIPDGTPPGDYQLVVKVYWYGDLVPLAVQMDGKAVGEIGEAAILGEIRIQP